MERKGFSENEEIECFRQYLRIETVHPVPEEKYAEAAEFIVNLGNKIEGLTSKTFEFVKGMKIVVLTLLGEQPELPSILLNSHIDVVPVEAEKWTRGKPFSADITENGDIIARGTQDMKCVGIQYLMAISRMRNEGIKFKRTFHVSFVPEEEVGGAKGMAEFVTKKEFADLNVGFSLDEGIASENDSFDFFYGERSPWWLTITANGQTGHASLLLEDTAVEKMSKVISRISNYRDSQQKISVQKGKTIGDVVSVNITGLKSGNETSPGKFQINVIPSTAMIAIDMRIDPTKTREQMEQVINEWIGDSKDTKHEFILQSPIIKSSDISSNSAWFNCFEKICNENEIKLNKEVFPAATDSRFLRAKGVQAFGFSPINNTKKLLHQHDEYLNKKTYIDGISIYCKLLKGLGNLEKHSYDK